MLSTIARFRTYLGLKKATPDQVMGLSYIPAQFHAVGMVSSKRPLQLCYRCSIFGTYVFDQNTERQIWR